MWYNCETLFDAGTTNGLRVWKPPGSSIEAFIADNFKFQSYWFELSVLGRFYTFDPSRSMSERHVSITQRCIASKIQKLPEKPRALV